MTPQSGLTSHARNNSATPGPGGHGATWLSAGGILAGLATASCCVVPFLLFTAGISGAWIANLTALEPYRLYFAGAAIGCIGFGFIASTAKLLSPATTARIAPDRPRTASPSSACGARP